MTENVHIFSMQPLPHLVEVGLESDAAVQVGEGLLGLAHGKVHRCPLEVGQVIRGVPLCRMRVF